MATCFDCVHSSFEEDSARNACLYCWEYCHQVTEDKNACEKWEGARMNLFHVGQLIIYGNGDSYEIGKIKRLTADGAFVWYHDGETAAKTAYEDMHPLVNEYAIQKTILGGQDGETV